MKIGILTYHRAHNYGAMLQAYALQHFLQSKGHQVDFIDYWPKEHAAEYSLFRPLRGTIVQRLFSLFSLSATFVRRALRIWQYKAFARDVLHLSSIISYPQHGATIYEHYDCVVVGSDQIWRHHETNGRYLGLDETYFCQTLQYSTRCISYAASMGVLEMDNKDKQEFRDYLSAFDTIYVREQGLANLIKSLGFEAFVVLDPTLLLDKAQWNQLIPQKRYLEERYLLYYEIIDSKEALLFAKQKAKELGCHLLVMDAFIHTIPRMGHIQLASPISFMHAIRDAEFLVLTSFHGTAFSLIFEKQFIATGMRNNADRVQTLLNAVGLHDYYQSTPKNLPSIDYTQVQQKLLLLRSESQDALIKAIDKNN